MKGALRFLAQLFLLPGGPDELSVFGYLLAFQALVIIAIVGFIVTSH